MITPESMFEMMNPGKAFEAMSQSKMLDVKAQSRLLDRAAEQVFGWMGAYQAQTRKVTELWLAQSEAALKEGQKLLKEWSGTFTKAGAEFVTEVESGLKEASKVFELPRSAKSGKTA